VTNPPFPLNDQVPPELRPYILDFWWDLEKLHSLKLPEKTYRVADFASYLDLPFWEYGGKPFTVTPNDVLHEPGKYHEQYARTLAVDLSHPIIVYERAGQPTVILDGLHRLLRAHMLGQAEIGARLFGNEQLAAILHD
jgi:hypothetical protein